MPLRSTAHLSEDLLVTVAHALGAKTVAGWSAAEEDLIRTAGPHLELSAEDIHALIAQGEDPLGDAFSRLRSPSERRPLGATYTPLPLVRWMLDWSSTQESPARIIDAGVGSGRFLLEAAQRFPRAQLVGIEIDPLAALIARANLAAAGLAHRAEILLTDYRSLQLPAVTGPTLFVGNPPYVRHHLISAQWKAWLVDKARTLGLGASRLAGLHAYFFLATALHAREGDFGVLITAAEWLDVNYGRLLRELFLGPLGGQDLVVLEPTAQPFPDAATTAAITTFRVGSQSRSISVCRAAEISTLTQIGNGTPLHRDRFAAETRWSHLTRTSRQVPDDFVELGELCRVHRGSVTGANKVWIADSDASDLPASVLLPSVTRARELFAAEGVLDDTTSLRRIIDLPVELDVFASPERKAIDRFLRRARARGADQSYIARHRKAWWSVGMRQAPPILATYMARRPPAFVRNRAGARYINIAHGLYPRDPMSEVALMNLARYLNGAICTSQGRTYAGGLTKFEPREMERLLVPHPAALATGNFA